MQTLKKFFLTILMMLFVPILMLSVMHFHTDIPLSEMKEKYAPAPSQFIEIDGMPVHYRIEGVVDSPAMVLIHGTASSLHTWEGWIPHFEKNYRLIRFDLPAFGLTGPHPNHDYSITYYVDFVNQLLQKFDVDSCVMAGNSLGGLIAWRYASKYPAKVQQLVLIDAAAYPRDKPTPLAFKLARNPITSSIMQYITPRSLVAESLKDVYGNDSLITEELVDRYFDMQLREGNRSAFTARANQTQKHSLEETIEAIKGIQQPTLILWGEADNWIPVEHANRFFDDLPNPKLVTYQEIGHIPMEEIPNETARDVLNFLEKVP
ncbi:MAG: alpha/beta fold hydrolase [Chitinophagales bacterium]